MAADDDRPVLSADEIDRRLDEESALGGWRRDGASLRRTFVFADFPEAFGFMAQMAVVAERLFHHPEWSNVYNRVEVTLTTHDQGGLTDLDLQLARRMSAAAPA